MLCVDEKPQIQALERGSATFPMRPGQKERSGHTYIRQGTTTFIAALDAKVGAVIVKCYPRHRAVEFVNFLEDVDQRVPPELAVHVIFDNDITHKTKVVQAWLLQHARYTFHFMPTSGSGLNLVESWCALLSRRRLRRGDFHTKDELKQATNAFIVQNHNQPQPFVWKRSADDILDSIRRSCLPYLNPALSQSSPESVHKEGQCDSSIAPQPSTPASQSEKAHRPIPVRLEPYGMAKKSAVDLSIPRGVRENAQRGLKLREEHGFGGTQVGEATATLLAKGGSVSARKVQHIARYFPRHAGDHLDETGKSGKPGARRP